MSDWGNDHKYEGPDRRAGDSKMLVLMTEIANDIRHMTKAFDAHVVDDAKTAKKVNDLEVNMAKWGGGLAALMCLVGIVVSLIK